MARAPAASAAPRPATRARVSLSSLESHDLGLTWVMNESFARASHALLDDGRVWLIDPVDELEAMKRVAELGEPAAVVQLLDRHQRDCAPIARRLGVPHLALPESLPDTPFEVVPVIDRWRWKEAALWWPGQSALVVAESFGTSPPFTVNATAVGVHPMLRLFPPRALARHKATHLLVGHGPPRHGPRTADELVEAVDRSRRDIPRLLAMIPRMRT